MGPFPHDAPAAAITTDNPMGTDGFEFVEYAHPEPEQLHALFKLMGYVPVARHKTKKITVYRQGDINYLVNEESGTHGCDFVAAHGPSARKPRMSRPRKRPSTFPRSRGSEEACSISLIATAPRDRPTTRNSSGSA